MSKNPTKLSVGDRDWASEFALAERLASQATEMRSSAEFALSEAKARCREGRPDLVRPWLLRSLSYSVGVFSPEYARVAE